MKNTKFLLTAAMALATLGLAGPSFGQAKAVDIVGLRLGMSPDEARAALKSHDATMKIVDLASWNARPGVPASLAKIRGCSSPAPNGPCKDEIVVTFGHLSKKALFITRVLKLGNGVLHQGAVDSLIGKYGQPTFRGSPSSLLWAYTTAGAPLGNMECAVSAQSPIESVTPRPQCGTATSSNIIAGPGALASEIHVATYEGQRLLDERALLVAAVKAHQEEIERAAKGNKVKL
ncbi:hypothetical protein ACFOLJ_27090 [Rugamonas sp. CCM 8940]|uniref:hypothetical protein n=1 Tax=Rugamonas sp. CCM 8940 TaxID=2765359 RepID=UPI0018F30E42|nr:hypothetical protein [Rugamonas sp. CCM 8940]MBJ7313619.1 hypothetical protein [Rugamonas sp. CCM 8940]